MEIKVLAIDLDGTLLNKYNQVLPESIEAIRLARQKGIEVVPSTGRLLCESRFAIEAIGGCNYSLHCNGSTVWDHRAGKPLFLSAFPAERSRDAIRRLEGYNILYQAYTEDASCCPRRFYGDFTDKILNKTYVEMFRDTQLWMDDLAEEISERGMQVVKYYVPNRDRALLERLKEEMSALEGFESTFSSNHSLEIFQTGTDKYNGLSKLLGHLGLGFENLMMIGDSENDLRAIEGAAIGVAMANGQDFVRQAADYVAPDHNQNGVAHAIHKFLLD